MKLRLKNRSSFWTAATTRVDLSCIFKNLKLVINWRRLSEDQSLFVNHRLHLNLACWFKNGFDWVLDCCSTWVVSMEVHWRRAFYRKLDFKRKCVLTWHCDSLREIEEGNTIVDDVLFLSMMDCPCSSDCSFTNSMTFCSSLNPMNFFLSFDQNVQSLSREGLIKRNMHITCHILSGITKRFIKLEN